MIVVDTNVIAYLLIDGERTEQARNLWQADPDWRVPPLWRAEFLSVLSTSVRAGVIEEQEALLLWRRATALLGEGEVEPGGEAVLTRSLRDGLSAYDAQFVAVAESLGVRFITNDQKILRQRRDVAIPLTDFNLPPRAH